MPEKGEFIKNPVVAEYLGLKPDRDFSEKKLENAIIKHIEKFLMEMGKGYALVDRQKHIPTEKNDYYIDLVFYNYILHCFVLIDLKTDKITYEDVGQMDMYRKMYDEQYRPEGHNPTFGIILCAPPTHPSVHLVPSLLILYYNILLSVNRTLGVYISYNFSNASASIRKSRRLEEGTE